MTSYIKRHLVQKVHSALKKKSAIVTVEQLIPQIVIGSVKRSSPEFHLILPVQFYTETDREIQSYQFNFCDIEPDHTIENSEFKTLRNQAKVFSFTVDKKAFIKDVLDSDPTRVSIPLKRENVVVDFSSPNVAKPFHAGHLRSTIIGNFICNLKEKLNKNVTRLNYLGDWGTQFGLLKYGVESLKIGDEELRNDPIHVLYQAYVDANKASETNPEVLSIAKEIFNKLENKDAECLEDWNKFRAFTVAELDRIYNRLGIKFDEYLWESSYDKHKIKSVIDVLESCGLVRRDESNRIVAVIREKTVPLLKSDGSSLYLTRDIASAIERHTRLNARESYYVTENGQTEHFKNLFHICKGIHLRNYWRMRHVKFGRIHGMSTRKGNVVFLNDILDEAKAIMYQKQLESPTTKGEVSEDRADVLGITAVIINDLKQRRQRDYEFSWEKALQTNGDTGIKLQYLHCRLYSLLSNSGAALPKECDPSALLEPEAVALVYQIARFEEVLYRANEDLESCILTSYLFQLCLAANRAFRTLKIKGIDVQTAEQRLLLFNTCRKVLAEGMRVLGIQPLKQM